MSRQWPIAAGMLQFPGARRDGTRAQDDTPQRWADDFAEIARAGFDVVEVNDQWVRFGDLAPDRVDDLAAAAHVGGLAPISVAIVRSSVIDPVHGWDNLAYTHRSIDAAARLGAGIASIGFHRPLLPAQRNALWFWTEPGATDDPDDPELWRLAVDRVRELGRHAAEVGLELTLELYEDGLLGSGPLAVRFVQDVGLGTVGLNPDIGNLVRLHRPIEDWVEAHELTLPFANYWHVKNYLRDEDLGQGIITTMPAPLALGVIDYRTEVRRALALGFQGVFVTEHYGGDGLGVSAMNRDYLRGILDGRPVPVPGNPRPDPERTRAALGAPPTRVAIEQEEVTA